MFSSELSWSCGLGGKFGNSNKIALYLRTKFIDAGLAFPSCVADSGNVADRASSSFERKQFCCFLTGFQRHFELQFF